jgi:hypothetical protein
MKHKEKRPHNSTYPKVAVQWFNKALCFYQSSCLGDNEVLQNRHLRVAAKRYNHFPSTLNNRRKTKKTIQLL